MTRDEMITSHLGLVGAVVRREFGDAPPDEWADLAAHGVLGLIAAVDDDHKRHTCSFSKWAWNRIRSVVGNSMRFAFVFRPPRMGKRANRRSLPRRHELHPDMSVRQDAPEGGSRDAEVSAALDQLPADERAAILLRFVHEMTWVEIQAELGHPGRRNWAYTTARRGLRRLRRMLAA